MLLQPSIPAALLGSRLSTLARVPGPLRRPGDRAYPSATLAILAERIPLPAAGPSASQAAADTSAAAVDPLYLFACHVEWEQREDTNSAWELIAAAHSLHADTRAHARALLAGSRHLGAASVVVASPSLVRTRRSHGAAEMKTPYGLPIIENCTGCSCSRAGFFCAFPPPVLRSLNELSHKSTLPAGAILFVEGQTPRGMFILCSGRVNLSTTARDGKVLILKTAEAGEALGLSAAISGNGYETTAEAASPCQLNFINREDLLELMQTYGDVSMRAAHALSRDFHAAYRDIHDLVLSRSSAGKLARLLLAQSREKDPGGEVRPPSAMTHEEMAQRIGSSRETVTRLLSDLRRKHLIHLEGPTLVIRDRDALEALAF